MLGRDARKKRAPNLRFNYDLVGTSEIGVSEGLAQEG